MTGARYAAIDQRVASIRRADPGIVRIKIWAPTAGAVLQRPRPGRDPPRLEDELEEALGGELENEISDLTADENVGERLVADQLFETYVPFRFDGERSGPP